VAAASGWVFAGAGAIREAAGGEFTVEVAGCVDDE